MRASQISAGVLGFLAVGAGSTGCGLVLGLGDYTDGPAPTGGSTTGGMGGGTTTTTASTTSATGGGTASATGGGGAGPTCTDMKRNGDETGVDCGGSCGPCPDGQGCMVGTDCASQVCSTGTCRAATCDDALKNGTETAVDCGGMGCPPCLPGKTCAAPSDCKSNVCTGEVCVLATCGDGMLNGTETAVDCGGSACPGCGNGALCNGPGDCASGICRAAACMDYGIWGKRFGDGDYQAGDQVGVDSEGNVVVLGEYRGTVDLGGTSFTNACVQDPMDPVPCASDHFLASFAADGAYSWARHFVNHSDNEFAILGFASALSASSGSSVVLSVGDRTINLGGVDLPPKGTCPDCGGSTTALGMIDSNGTHKWSKRFNGSTSTTDVVGTSVATSPFGNIAMTGYFNGGVNFGTTTATALTAAMGGAFLVSFDNSGNHRWSKGFGSASSNGQCGQSVAIDGAGNVLMAGYFYGAINLGGSTLTSSGSADIFIAKFNDSGTHLWSKRFGDAQDQSFGCGYGPALTIAVDPSGNALLGGPLKGTVDFGGNPLTSTGTDAFLVRFSAAGATLWSKQLTGTVTLASIAADPANSILLAGRADGGVDLGGGPLAGTGGWAAKLTANGDHVWSHRLSGLQGTSIVGDLNALYLTGSLFGSELFAGQTLTSAGNADAFVAKLVNP